MSPSLSSKLLDVDIYSSTEWTGGRQDHLLFIYLMTSQTSQRYIRKLFVWESVDLCTFLPRPADFHPCSGLPHFPLAPNAKCSAPRIPDFYVENVFL